jgi:hypothetical protein
MAQALEQSQAAPKVVATFLGALGGLGLVLASIGLHAVVAFAVARRSREIGIRMALGARSQQVVWSVARGVAGLIGVATSIGFVLTVLITLALRATSGSADIGIGNMGVHRPNIDPVMLGAIAAVDGTRRRCRRIRARAPGRPNGSTRGLAPRVTSRPVRPGLRQTGRASERASNRLSKSSIRFQLARLRSQKSRG